MDQRKSSWAARGGTDPAETLLESRHAQMLQWAKSLTRGDETLADEIVQDLCLQLTLSRPDPGEIANLDGYLYTCLRHLYLSRLTRASREAVRLVSIEDCDSMQFALDGGHLPESVNLQNQLRRICSYSLWRRETSKSFSCFILHFFHGYFHREIADLACLPMPAIYNKLKTARAEIRSHLIEPEKLQFLNRSIPPDPLLSWTAIPSAHLFRELRETILAARVGSCLTEQELLSWYRSSSKGPIPCALLAHIVSCERCLEVVDRHFQRPGLEDRDALDGDDRALRGDSKIHAMPASLERRRRRLYEHRPITLSIAVNGSIVATHKVQGETSVLSARIDRPESAKFVEVFSEQNVRLALLPVEPQPPQGAHVRISRAELSDGRWLELHVAFDGLGLSSELTYRDPALVSQEFEEETEELPMRNTAVAEAVPASPVAAKQEPSTERSGPSRWLGWLWPSSAPAWALAMLCLVTAGGWIAWRMAMRPLSAQAILQRSIESETAALKGNAEHQDFLFEQLDAEGRVTAQGTVDLWKDGSDGRMMRRLYDADHRLVAATWRLQNGTLGSYVAKRTADAFKADRQLISAGIWSQDVSPEAFRSLAADSPHGGATADGYELTARVHDVQEPQVVAATLILDRRFRSGGETLRMGSGAGYAEVRYRQIAFESEPAAAAPDSVFDPSDLENGLRGRSSLEREKNPFAGTDTESARLEMAVLYRLFLLHADADQPIAIARTPQHRVRVEGSIADAAMRHQIVDALEAVPEHNALDLHIASPNSGQSLGRHAGPAASQAATVYTVVQSKAPADAALRGYLARKGEPATQMDVAVTTLEHSELDHAQHALQQAYALHRLGTAFSADELRALPEDARRQWTAMAAGHARALQTELLSLQQPLSGIAPHAGSTAIAAPNEAPIDAPEAFARATARMLEQVQTMNRRISDAFTSAVDRSGAENSETQNPDALLAEVVASIPLPQAQALSAFALHLDGHSESKGSNTAMAGHSNS